VAALVSTIIPTYNRLEDVLFAVRSARAQTHREQEIIVIDDGSTDDTSKRLAGEHGDAVRILRTERLGVSGARNRGMQAARGDFIAFLDSDDEWTKDKLEKQVAWFEARPDFGMVITDVVQMDRDRREYDVVRRRPEIPVDGDVLRHVLLQPRLAPSSALLRRRVYDEVGGFDVGLRTAEDIDFHLRVALRFKIGVIEEPLTRAMRGHEGLSALPQTYADYLYVMVRYLLDHRHEIPVEDRRAALRTASLRNMRGLLVTGNLKDGLALGARLAKNARSPNELLESIRLMPLAMRVAARRLYQRVRRNEP
jgi:glycosyltransferase involved in cell wall biosynthesis